MITQYRASFPDIRKCPGYWRCELCNTSVSIDWSHARAKFPGITDHTSKRWCRGSKKIRDPMMIPWRYDGIYIYIHIHVYIYIYNWDIMGYIMGWYIYHILSSVFQHRWLAGNSLQTKVLEDGGFSGPVELPGKPHNYIILYLYQLKSHGFIPITYPHVISTLALSVHLTALNVGGDHAQGHAIGDFLGQGFQAHLAGSVQKPQNFEHLKLSSNTETFAQKKSLKSKMFKV